MPDTDSLLEAALHSHQRGALEEAEPLYTTILTQEPDHFTATLLLGVLRNQREDFHSAAELLSRAVEADPNSALAHLNLGLALWHLNQPEEAIQHYRHSLRLAPNDPSALLNCASALQERHQPGEALVHWDRFLTLDPGSPAALMGRAMALQDLQRPEEALSVFDQALALDPQQVVNVLERAKHLDQAARHQEALDTLDRVLKVRPGWVDALVERGMVLLKLHRAQEALVSLDVASLLDPRSLVALHARANVLLVLQRPAEALAACERALALQPDSADLLLIHGIVLIHHHRAAEALAAFERALALAPERPDLHMNRGSALHLLGRHREALTCYERALSLDPHNAVNHSSKIGLLDFLPEMGLEEHQDARRAFFEAHATRLPSPDAAAPADRRPSRRLVLGYVSRCFMGCSTVSTFLPILQRHSREDFQIICYSDVLGGDDWTQRCRKCSDVWRETAGLSDEALAARIRADGVDILVDLSGHTPGNRLLVFARKPAPIQVTAWGHGGGTGLPMMDYLFADPTAIPPSDRPQLAEEVYDLPCHLTFEAPDSSPDLVELPALTRDYVTFGSLNRYSKITPAVERLWARILVSVPGSRLVLKDTRFEDPAARETVMDAFHRLGIAPERIEFRGSTSREGHLAAYGDIDIHLDPFPLNGGVTTWESLWMGTPVVSKLGDTLGSRASGAILRALDLREWVAEDEDGYLAVAVRMAARVEALAEFRCGIRSRILASPAGNPALYTRAVEAAFRAMWIRWLAKTSGEPTGRTLR